MQLLSRKLLIICCITYSMCCLLSCRRAANYSYLLIYILHKFISAVFFAFSSALPAVDKYPSVHL